MHTDGQFLLTSLRLETNGVPIYVQLRDQLLRAIEGGVLPPGAQMPTMRQVAVALRIDLNTVRHAYDALERTGAIDLIRGRGSFVAALPLGADPPPDRPIDRVARQAIAFANSAGIDPAELANHMMHLLQREETDQ